MGPKRDPQEDDLKLKPIIAEIAVEARRRLYKKYCLDENVQVTWVILEIWSLQKSLLKKKGINWKTPIEMNSVSIPG